MRRLNMRRRSVRLSILAGFVIVGGVLFGQEAQIVRTKVAPTIVRTTPDAGGIRIKSLPIGSILESKETVPDKSQSFMWFEVMVVNDKGDRVSGYIQDSEVDVINSIYANVPIRNWVNDAVGVLKSDEVESLIRNLIELDEKNQIPIVVLIINLYKDYQTPDDSLESFAAKVFNSYHIGDQDKNLGILVLVSIGDRRIRISLGAGYETAREGKMDAIINAKMIPSFRNQDYGRGILEGVKAVIDEVKSARKTG